MRRLQNSQAAPGPDVKRKEESLNENLNTVPDNLGTLYVVATPIGHLDDLTRRAEHVLREVQIIAAEDTRRTSGLLAHIGESRARLISLHDHNEETQTEHLMSALLQGQDVALVSDAGTPLINDPGFKLVQTAQARGVRCVPVPGCSSVIAVLSVCPLPCQTFTYLGFVPSKARAREQFLREALAAPQALVMFETPHRIQHTLTALNELTTRRLMLARELTKQHESLYVGSAAEVLAALGERPKGEMVMVIEAQQQQPVDLSEDHVLRVLLKEMPPSRAAKVAASLLGLKKQPLYDRARQLAEQAKPGRQQD